MVVLGTVTTTVVLTRSGGDQPAPPGAGPADQLRSEICDPPSWDGEITAEGVGSSQVSLDGLPDHLFFYLTYSYTPGDGSGWDYFQINILLDGEEFGFIDTFQDGEVTGSGLLRNRYSDGSPTALVVNTEGPWSLRIQELLATPVWPEITEGEWSSHMRAEPGTLTGPTRVVADHDDYFSVNVYTDRPAPPGQEPIPEQLVLSPQAGTSDFVLPANTCLVAISALGPWTLTLP